VRSRGGSSGARGVKIKLIRKNISGKKIIRIFLLLIIRLRSSSFITPKLRII
jgi:hypothetical protein